MRTLGGGVVSSGRGTWAHSPRNHARKRLFVTLGVAAGIVVALTSCSLFGGKDLEQTNMANQRKAAMSFIDVHRNVEAIRFTDEGEPHGLGGSLWTAPAVITVGDVEYHANIGFELGLNASEPLPSASPGHSPGPVTVTFSDGNSEVLK